MILEYKQIPIFYTDHGEGNAVVLLHGFLETSNMWKDLIPEIENNHRIIAIDLLGHGQTGCLGYVHTMEMMAEAVAFVLKHLKLSEAVFIGHSMGGYVALALAEAFPKLIKRMCLANSTPFADSEDRKVNRDRAIRVVKQSPKSFISMSIANLFSPENRELMSEEINQIKHDALQLSVQGIIAALEGMKIRKDRSELLRNLKFPKVVLLGDKDPVLEYVSLLNRLNTLGVKIIVFDGGHMTYIENNYDFSYFVKQFIEN